MGVRRLTILALAGVLCVTGAAAQEDTEMTTTPTATSNPAALGVREKLGPDFQFLLDTLPPSGDQVSPGQGLILRSLCGTCTPNQDDPWSTVVVTREDGTTVTLTDLHRMHQEGAGWGEIAQRELGVKLGTLVRETATGGKFQTGPMPGEEGTSTPSATTTAVGEETAAGLLTGKGRAARPEGRAMKKTGIVTGTGRSLGTLNRGPSGAEKAAAGIVTGSGRALGLSGVHPGKHGGIVTGSGRGVAGHGHVGGPPSSPRGRGHRK